MQKELYPYHLNTHQELVLRKGIRPNYCSNYMIIKVMILFQLINYSEQQVYNKLETKLEDLNG